MQLVLTHRILRSSAQGFIPPVCTTKSLASKLCSPRTNLVLNPHIKFSGCDTVESDKYLQIFQMNLWPPSPEYSSALKMETADSY